jgi:hypothetical protein
VIVAVGKAVSGHVLFKINSVVRPGSSRQRQGLEAPRRMAEALSHDPIEPYQETPVNLSFERAPVFHRLGHYRKQLLTLNRLGHVVQDALLHQGHR